MPSKSRRKTFRVLVGLLLLCGAIKFVGHKAALRRGYVPSSAETAFRFSEHDLAAPPVAEASWNGVGNFTSDVPILILRSERPGSVSTSKDYSEFELAVYEPKDSEPANLQGSPTFQSRVGLRLHGMVSKLFPKLSYRLKLQDESDWKHRTLLGMPGDADWVLQGPWLDKSLIRNAFSYDLARAMGGSAMRARACEVFLSTSGQPVTEADYLGVYQLVEHIERGPQRINLTKLSAHENSEPAISGGYLLAWDVGEGTYLANWKSIQVKYPNHPSREQMAWIDRAMTEFNRALSGSDYRDAAKGYAAYIDVDAWVNYTLFEELIFNLDGYSRSFYLQKDRGAKIQPGPVWDHDLALGHQFQNGTSFTEWWYTRSGSHHWFTRLATDPAFAAKLAQRWTALRQGVLSDEQIQQRIDAFAAPLLTGAADRNFQRWKVLNIERPFPKPNDYITIKSATYPEQITALKNFLHQRAAWMDEQLARRARE